MRKIMGVWIVLSMLLSLAATPGMVFAEQTVAENLAVSADTAGSTEDDIISEQNDIGAESGALDVFEKAEMSLLEEDGMAVMEIPVTEDAMVQASTKGNNFGITKDIFSAAKNGGLSREIFLKFDLSELRRSGAMIAGAELWVTYSDNRTDNRSAREYQVFYTDDDSWAEGDKDNAKSNVENAITWDNSRTMAENSVMVYDSGTTLLTQSNTTPTVIDVTGAFEKDNDDFLSLRLVTGYKGNQTWGIHVYSQEADVEAQYKPHLRVKTVSDPDMITVLEDAGNIAIQDENGEPADLDAVTGNLILPTVGASGETEISWDTSDYDVISLDPLGQVTQPAFDENDAEVTLTATVRKGTATYSKKFQVKVLKEDPTP